MPAPAKFSEQSYERVGHQFVEELVDWLIRNDHAFRSELREINELNFARFEATLDKRMEGLEARIDRRILGVEAKLDQEIHAVEVKLEQRIHAVEVNLTSEVARLEDSIRSQTAALRGDLLVAMAQMETRMTRRLLGWMFVFWTGTTITLLGSVFAILRLWS